MTTDTDDDAPPPDRAESGSALARLGDRYEILPERSTDLGSRPGREVLRARDVTKTSEELVAIVTSPQMPARIELLSGMRALDVNVQLPFVDAGVLEWTDGSQRFALVFRRPHAPPLLQAATDRRAPMGEDEIVRAIMTPFANSLRALAARSMFHGGVRTSNIYYAGGSTAAVLGEAVSGPPSFDQPAIFEPIERALSQPDGRGNGTPEDDMYALGVVIAILALGRDPLAEMDADRAIGVRIDRGSYNALIGNIRIPSALVEPLRGMLADEARQRWTIDDLQQWLGGRRQSPKQPQLNRRSPRPLELAGKELWRPRDIAHAFSRNIHEAVKAIESGELDRWLRRTLGDIPTATRVAEAMGPSAPSARGGAFEERLVARVSMALDPSAPIRYKGLAVMPLGIGYAMAAAIGQGQSAQSLAEVIGAQLPLFWFNVQAETQSDVVGMVKQFDQYRALLERGGMGYGVERCIYEMVPGVPCASDMLRGRYVIQLGGLLEALEAIAARDDRPSAPLDRHVAGFVAALDRRVGDAAIAALNARGEGDRALAMLALLASVQRRHGPQSLPQLAQWFVALLTPTLGRFHNRQLRKTLGEELADAARRGDLTELLQLIDDASLLQRDTDGFEDARKRYDVLAAETKRLRRTVADKRQLELGAGREAAAAVSGILAIGAIALTLLFRAALL